MRALGSSRRVSLLVALGLLMTASACGGGGSLPEPTSSVSAAPSPSPTAASVPADGITLTSLGFEHSPPNFTLPRTTIFVTAVDQPNVVTMVLRSPEPVRVSAYLRTNLPAAGYTITAATASEGTFTFVGHGWSGSFTTSGEQCAVVVNAP